jgi:hydroxyethylthiazole kinase-like sugar kinase family protein
MKFLLLPAAFAVLVAAGSALPPPALAKGCLKGAVVGGVAGHYAGHHAVLGAVSGCVVGHHLAAQHAKQEKAREQPPAGDADADARGGSDSGR